MSMNRRQFFGMTLAAVAAAGLPAIVLPERKIFLPPAGGWFSHGLRMREVRAYSISTDELLVRYDVIVGTEQFGVDMRGVPEHLGDSHREIARQMLVDIIEHDGLTRERFRVPALPVGMDARYV